MTTPRGLLLDFGGVVSVSIFERQRETEAILGLPSNSLRWLGGVDPDSDPLWQRMQRDEISEREYWAIRAREVGEAVGESGWNVNTFLRRVRQANPASVIRPQMQTLVTAARLSGIRLGILSNELELFYGRECLEKMTILQQFDTIVDASVTNVLKPDPRSYMLAIEALRLFPREILFVDDQFRNITGAVKAGLQTQYFDLRDVSGNIRAVAARLDLSSTSLA